MASLIHHSRSFHVVNRTFDGTVPDDALACIQFGTGLSAAADPRHVTVGLQALQAEDTEVWLSDAPVTHGIADGFRYAHNGDVLFASLRLDAAELHDLERATLKAYVRIEGLVQHLGYPCWLRMWNFLGGINEGEGDHERYRQFSAGRYRALALKPEFEASLPAATAIGMLEPGLVIYFLAARAPGQQVENPRQVSAFRYPRQYGPRSPSFSRATLLHHHEAARLLLSGTASVVGHETMHAGDARAQLGETAANIGAVLASACDAHRLADGEPEAEQIKLYLRDPALAATLKAPVRDLLGDAPALWLHGHICRRDLLLEIEAVYSLPGSPA